MLTNPTDQTKNQVVLLVESPTKPYRILCSRCERHWWFWLGPGALTNPYHIINLAVDQYRIVLPCLTSRGVKYTHNDINSHIPRGDSGPTRIRPIPTEHIQKEIVVGDGGA